MWYLTLRDKKAFENTMHLYICESDEEWADSVAYAMENGIDFYKERKQELEVLRDHLLHYLPQRFHTYVFDGTLNTPNIPKHVRDDYLMWREEQERLFGNVLDAAYEQKLQTLPHLNPKVREVFEKSLHDTKIANINRHDNQVVLTIDTAGGFTTKSIIFLSFMNIASEVGNLEAGQYYIYDELRKTVNGFALRVIFDCPEVEWTIEAKEIATEFYYRPKTYSDFAENEDLLAYIQTLHLEHGIMFITPQFKSRVIAFQEQSPFLTLEDGHLYKKYNGVFVDDIRVADTLADCIHFLHTQVYEDPYAHFSEPVPEQELEEAALGTNLELKVRAWNTMYANPVLLAETINKILKQMNPEEEDEMMQYVFIRHFYKEGILSDELQAKFKNVLED